jgi:hypothetical protein
MYRSRRLESLRRSSRAGRIRDGSPHNATHREAWRAGQRSTLAAAAADADPLADSSLRAGRGVASVAGALVAPGADVAVGAGLLAVAAPLELVVDVDAACGALVASVRVRLRASDPRVLAAAWLESTVLST